jgi:hypothetical protein
VGKNFAVQISISIFEKNCGGGVYKYPIKIYQGRQSSYPLLAKLKVLSGSLTDLSELGKNFAVLDIFFMGY